MVREFDVVRHFALSVSLSSSNHFDWRVRYLSLSLLLLLSSLCRMQWVDEDNTLPIKHYSLRVSRAVDVDDGAKARKILVQ